MVDCEWELSLRTGPDPGFFGARRGAASQLFGDGSIGQRQNSSLVFGVWQSGTRHNELTLEHYATNKGTVPVAVTTINLGGQAASSFAQTNSCSAAVKAA